MPINNTLPETLEGGHGLRPPMRFAPQNELGVVFLFSYLARKWRIKVETIRPQFPDCIARQRVGGKEREIRIEFEYKSRHFTAHGHPAKKCDWIVCWEHNWPEVPPHLRVIELRREFGLGFNVWFQAVSKEYKEIISSINQTDEWSFAKSAHKGDLILFYHTSKGGERPSEDRCVRDIFRITGPGKLIKSAHQPGQNWEGPIRRVCRLAAPVFLEDLKRHRVLQTSGMLRANMQGRNRATEYWPYLYDLIVRRNPRVAKKLARYSPEQLEE